MVEAIHPYHQFPHQSHSQALSRGLFTCSGGCCCCPACGEFIKGGVGGLFTCSGGCQLVES